MKQADADRIREIGTANRPIGPWGIFSTGPHRTVREVVEEYADIFRDWLWEWRQR